MKIKLNTNGMVCVATTFAFLIGSLQLSGCIRNKPNAEQKSLRNSDTGELLYENIALGSPDVLVLALSSTTDIVSKLPICYFNLPAQSDNGQGKLVTNYPVYFGDALNLFSTAGVDFNAESVKEALNRELFSLMQTSNTISSGTASGNLELTSANLNLSPEMQLLPLGIAKLFISSKLLGWGSVSKILGAIKFAAKPLTGAAVKKFPSLAGKLGSIIANVSAKSAPLLKRKEALVRLTNIRNLKAAKNVVTNKKGLAKIFSGVTGLASRSMYILPWFAGDIYSIVKDSGVAGKNPSEDQVAKQLELFTPEELEQIMNTAGQKTEDRLANNTALQTDMDSTAKAMEQILIKYELSASNALFQSAEAELTKMGIGTQVSSVPCTNPEDTLLEAPVESL
jgi:hypothetical protein